MLYRTCGTCKGTGRTPIGRVHAKTLELLSRHPRKSGAELSKIMGGVSGCAMANRLKALERQGLVIGERMGREIVWRVAK